MFSPLRGLLLFLAGGAFPLCSQVVPSQANMDAQAQRRIQANAQESFRRQRINDNIAHLVPSLDPAGLTGPKAPVLTRRAMAALADLSSDGIPPNEALQRAIKASNLDTPVTQKTSAYLLGCWADLAGQITPEDIEAMKKGNAPKTPWEMRPYQP